MLECFFSEEELMNKPSTFCFCFCWGRKKGSIFFASNDQEGAGTEPEPEIIMGPIQIFKQYLTYFL